MVQVKSQDGSTERGPVQQQVLLDWEGAAAFLNVTPRLVRDLWQRRQLSGVKVGRRVRFKESDLVEYIDRHRVEAKP